VRAVLIGIFFGGDGGMVVHSPVPLQNGVLIGIFIGWNGGTGEQRKYQQDVIIIYKATVSFGDVLHHVCVQGRHLIVVGKIQVVVERRVIIVNILYLPHTWLCAILVLLARESRWMIFCTIRTKLTDSCLSCVRY
jgi:hypothetical protein